MQGLPRDSASDSVRYLAFLAPLLGATALIQNRPLFRSDEAILSALSQPSTWTGGLSTFLGQLCLQLPLGNFGFRLALPAALGCGLLGLACFELSYALFRAQGGYSRLDPWLAWGASLVAALNTAAAAEGTVAGGASLAPAIALYFSAQLIAQKYPRGLVQTGVWGLAVGALASESVHCAFMLLPISLLLWPIGQRRSRQLGQHLPLLKIALFFGAALAALALISFKIGWFSRSWVLPSASAASFVPERPWQWVQAVGVLWALGALVALAFALTDRRPIYVMVLLALSDWLLPSLAPITWTSHLSTDQSRSALHLFALAYFAAAGALGLRTFGETAQAIGLLGARQLALLISVVAVGGSLAAAEDSLMTLGQTTAEGAEAWSEAALQVLPPRTLVITESVERGQRLRAAQLLGARPDVLVVPLSELSLARNVRRWLKHEPELHLLLVDLSLGHSPSEQALGRLIDTRPVFVEPNAKWGRRILEHLKPALPLSQLSSHALARSDRLDALKSLPERCEQVMSRVNSGLRPDEAALSLIQSDLLALETTLSQVDQVAALKVAELRQTELPSDRSAAETARALSPLATNQ